MTKLIKYFNSLNKILDKKERTKLLKDYNNWVKYQDSIIDGSPNVSRPHHAKIVGHFGTGKRPNDLFQVPITYQQHQDHHQHYPKYQDVFIDRLPELHMRFLHETNQYKILNEIECGRL